MAAAESEPGDEPGSEPGNEPADRPDDPQEAEPPPEDVREGVVDIVAYAVGAAAFIALGYFTQRTVLTWTRGPVTVVCLVMAVHWVGRRVRARRVGSRGTR